MQPASTPATPQYSQPTLCFQTTPLILSLSKDARERQILALNQSARH